MFGALPWDLIHRERRTQPGVFKAGRQASFDRSLSPRPEPHL